jgi:hypothetical protein
MEDDHLQEVEAKQVINNLKLEQNKVLMFIRVSTLNMYFKMS